MILEHFFDERSGMLKIAFTAIKEISPEEWQKQAEHCPGMNRGELIPVEEIRIRVKTIKM